MVNNGNDVNTASTPRRYTKRSSAEYIRAMSSPGGSHEHEAASPETPSPPRQGRRSSTSLGFFTSPLHPRAEAAISRSGHPSSSDNGLLMPQSPNIRSRLLPPTTPKSRNAEMFLSPSPNLKSPGTYRDNGKPIREISNGLKARLNYALVKLQNGWVEKTLPELENELSNTGKRHKHEDDDEEDLLTAERLELARETVLKGSSYNNEFLRDSEESVDEQDNTVTEEDGDSNSAHIAFLKALSSPKKRIKQEGVSRSPLQWSEPKKTVTTEKEKDHPSEVEAIETLMSLSSPQRSRSANQEFSLPVPPKVPKSSSPTTSTSSDSSSANESRQKRQLELSRQPKSGVVVPIMQKQSSESSSESLKESFQAEEKAELRYDRQQQTDVETDVELSDND
ncbi:hypothetical protein HG536_0H02320 [Torulaspora globosa]|uniref:Uncharacterized protein n=1 Tax=Torulaspora globosa TaxID=48254 RepID=A0A7G3ZMX1_9SACH|nr:uncharacterized protein HG536_0H02320 [Torulaspora globosa]QLL34857.1 hypothetical protein HG536_0H02320 [Torulaspora globosa]